MKTDRYFKNIDDDGVGVLHAKIVTYKKVNIFLVKKNDLNWQEQLVDELHKPIKRNFIKKRVIFHHIEDIWSADLVEVQKYSKSNKGYKYLLMVLDIFSKYGWIKPLKD